MESNKFTAPGFFGHANKFIEAYHATLQPICKETGLPPMAIDILMFVANNPERATAKDICALRGFKSGIVSVHIERLVSEGLIKRCEVPGDRRKTLLACTESAAGIIEKGRALQKCFADNLLTGLSESEIETFHNCLHAIGKNIDAIRKNGMTTHNSKQGDSDD